ncbi:MAG: J domain-containing protein [Rhizobiaceae bacterium]|nr:J domain-containing protein [Rhizobiaceae bacterium]
MRSPYAVLGISQTDRDEDIKLAYRKLAKIWHPDQNHSDPRAQEVFAEINNAYHLLTDAPRRKLFDAGKIDANGRRRKKRTVVNTGFNPFKKSSTSSDAGDKATDKPFFKDKKQAEQTKPSETIKASAKSTPKAKPSTSRPKESALFEERLSEIFGSEEERLAAEELDAYRRKTRPNASENTNFHEEAMSVLDDAFTKFEQHRHTSTTQAPDSHYDVDVELADIFTGVTLPIEPHRKHSLNVHIPAGTADGAKIKIGNMGSCRKGEIPGDVVVTVRYKSNEQFWVRNGELHTHLAVELADAVLGGEVTAQTPEGPATFMLPEWTSSNHIIRIPKRGLPTPNGERGDLCANVCILLPEKPNDELITVLKDSRKSWFM